MIAEITIMDRAVYDMGALHGAQWLRARISAGKLADIYELLERTPAGRLGFADKQAERFGLDAVNGGMQWNHYKRRAYGVGWLAGLYAALIEAIPAPRMLDALVIAGLPV